MTYIKLRQEQTQIVESERSIEDLIDLIYSECDETFPNPRVIKDSDIPWEELINEETLIAAARSDVVYFAEHKLNNIIITDRLFNKKTTLINFLRENLYDYIDDDDDCYAIIDTTRHNHTRKFIVDTEEEKN